MAYNDDLRQALHRTRKQGGKYPETPEALSYVRKRRARSQKRAPWNRYKPELNGPIGNRLNRDR